MIFYRFGEIPKNEKSGIWKGEEKVGKEFGVSVYEAHKNINGTYSPVIPFPTNENAFNDFIHHIEYFTGNKYLVTGDLLEETGTDGEPLIKNVKILEKLQIMNIEDIKFKPIKKDITYEDVCNTLFKNNTGYFIDQYGEVNFYNIGTNRFDINNAPNGQQLKRLLALNQLLNIAEYYNRNTAELNVRYRICYDSINYYYKVVPYASYNFTYSLEALFNNEEDAQEVIDNPNFREILDTIYKDQQSMKISELQNILEHYKQENGDLEIRITAETRFNEQHEILDYDAIDINVVYDKTEFNNLVINKGLTEARALDILDEKGLSKMYLDIYTYIKG